MSRILNIADAVVALLNGEVFDPPFVATRELVPTFDLSKVGDDPIVQIYPRGIVKTIASRSSSFFDVAIDIGLQRRIQADDPKCDVMFGLAEAIFDFLERKPLDALLSAQFRTSENEPAVFAEHLTKFQVFTSITTCAYRVTA